MKWFLRLMITMAAGLLLAGCTRPDRHEARVEALKARVSTLLAERAVPVRYNPVQCSCPPFELKLDDARWQRIQMVDESEPDDAERPTYTFVQKATEDHRSGLRTVYAEYLALEQSSPQSCPNGTLFFNVTVVPPTE
jgi:hypothetical protein